MRVSAAACALLLLLCAQPALAKVTDIPLSELVVASDTIVIARVDEVAHVKISEPEPLDFEPREIRTATVTVLFTIKGRPPPQFEVDATATWICDTSFARKGETVLLFLDDGLISPEQLGMLGDKGLSISDIGKLPRARPMATDAGANPKWRIAHDGRGRRVISWPGKEPVISISGDGIIWPEELTPKGEKGAKYGWYSSGATIPLRQTVEALMKMVGNTATLPADFLRQTKDERRK